MITKQQTTLREALIKCVVGLCESELTGYVVYDGDSYSIEKPNYSEQKDSLIKMIEEIDKKVFTEGANAEGGGA